MIRRCIIRFSFFGFALLGLSGCSSRLNIGLTLSISDKPVCAVPVSDNARRLNILLIITDEQCADAMSCMGNPNLKTPNMDRLARQGVVFQKAYTTQPLCVPYRTSLQTGRWPHQTGVMVNNIRFLPSGVPQGPMLGKMVRDAGYQCGYLGKMHICNLQPGNSRSLYLRPEDQALHGYNPAWECKDAEIAPGFKAFLVENPSDPFFFIASFDDPHDCLRLGSNPNNLAHLLGKVPDDPALLPPLPKNHNPAADEPEVVKAYWDQLEIAGDQKDGEKLKSSDSWSELQWRQYLWAYYRLVEKVDKDIGHTLDALEASGRAKDTVVIFTVDHGDGAAHRRRRCKQTLYDECARVPFIVSGASVLKKGTLDSAHLVSANDIYPTILDYAGIEKPTYASGQSLRSLVETGSWEDHPFVVTQTLFNKGILAPGWAGRMVRTPKYKYILYNQGEGREQLFDMESDPLEMCNLVQDPKLQEILQQHRAMLDRWCRQNNDPFLKSMLVKWPVSSEREKVAVADFVQPQLPNK
jgi:arylsulfatase A-like enzyme